MVSIYRKGTPENSSALVRNPNNPVQVTHGINSLPVGLLMGFSESLC